MSAHLHLDSSSRPARVLHAESRRGDDGSPAADLEDVEVRSIGSIMANVRRRAQSTAKARTAKGASSSSDDDGSDGEGDDDPSSDEETSDRSSSSEEAGARRSDTRFSTRITGTSWITGKLGGGRGRPIVLPFRVAVTVPVAVAIFLSCIGVGTALTLMFMFANGKVVTSYKDSVNIQRKLMNRLGGNANELAFKNVLSTIDRFVFQNVVEPPDRALDSLWGSMRLFNTEFGISTKIPRFKEVFWYSAWVELMDQWEDRQQWGPSYFTTAVSLYIATPDEMLVGASITHYGKYDQLLYYAPPVPMGQKNKSTTMSVYPANNETGKPVTEAGQPKKIDERTFIPTTRPYYEIQERVKATELEPRTVWSKLYDFVIPVEQKGTPRKFGLSQTRPVAYCGNYDCFEGVIVADILLETINVACNRTWTDVRSLLARPAYNFTITESDSAVFIVNRKSTFYPDQEGILIGASHTGDFVRDQNATFANRSSSPIIADIATAIFSRYGSWRSVPGEEDSPLAFVFSRTPGVDCNFTTPRNRDTCMQVATRVFELDRDVEWLIVVGLPAPAFTEELAKSREKIDDRVKEQEDVSARTLHRVVILCSTVGISMTLASVVLGLRIARTVSEPLKQLGKRMHRLETLDTSTHATMHRRSTLAVREVQEVHEGFSRLTRSIKGFARFVPETVVRNIVSGDSRKRGLHVDSKIVTIMFSDVKDFTTIAESLDPQDLILTLYMYLTAMTRIVERFEGVVSEILGDGLLVFWNTPEDVEFHSGKACAAALAQQQALASLNEKLIGLQLPPLAIRIGLHTGRVLAGNIGSETKMKFGCIGDPINLASRLEGLAKYYGVSALCSGATRANLPRGHFALRKLDLVQVKGKREPVEVHELIGRILHADASASPDTAYFNQAPLLVALPERCRRAQMYEQALDAFQQARLGDAAVLAEALLRESPDDVAAQRLLERALRPPSPQDAPFSPVLQMTNK
mmetsp:Transcript_25506/g.73653  ORF Transcript_25506/g.73653 Transcript_25506/m.73653 type:complete len:977 (+) Transcript_25506:18-2948(+)